MGEQLNHKVALAGMLTGLLVVFAFFSGLTATGFSVAVGEQTINFGQTFTEDTLIPLSLPQNISSFSITGVYRGSGDARIHLVGPEDSWHLASYDAPQVQLNSTFVLERGGTVVQLAEGQNINYTHVFEDVCGQACDGPLQGPFYVQLRVRGGEFTLTSASYTTPQIVSRPQQPDSEEIVVDLPAPEETVRENPPVECQDEQTSELRCLEGYFISQTGHLNITDSSGRLVALFDKQGRLMLAGDIIENTDQSAPVNAFRIQNRQQDIAWITDSGDLHLIGRLVEGANEVPLSGSDNFVIRNPQEIVLVVQGATGDLFTKSSIITNALS